MHDQFGFLIIRVILYILSNYTIFSALHMSQTDARCISGHFACCILELPIVCKHRPLAHDMHISKKDNVASIF